MIQKIIAIKNVGRFLNTAAAGDVFFRRCNMIFAENGRGKTTLCAILRSMQSGEPAYIIGRRTLGSVNPPEVRFLLDGNLTVAFYNGAWHLTLPQLVVFDSTFVTEHVHAGEAVLGLPPTRAALRSRPSISFAPRFSPTAPSSGRT